MQTWVATTNVATLAADAHASAVRLRDHLDGLLGAISQAQAAGATDGQIVRAAAVLGDIAGVVEQLGIDRDGAGLALVAVLLTRTPPDAQRTGAA